MLSRNNEPRPGYTRVPEVNRSRVAALAQTETRLIPLGIFLTVLAMSYATIFGTQAAFANTTKGPETSDRTEIADESTLFIGQQGLHVNRTSLPRLGMNMDQVAADFGEGLNKIPEIGEPPISRWEYEDYTVYFEHKSVLHVVVHPLKP